MNSSVDDIIWDQSWSALRFSGNGAKAFLHGQTTTDLNKLPDGKLAQSCWLSNQGKLKAILEIRLSSNYADLIVLSGNIDEVKTGLEKFIFPCDEVKLESTIEIRRIQFISKNSKSKFTNVIWTKPSEEHLGFKSFDKASSEDIELWRLEKGIPIAASELTAAANPFELGLSDLVSLNKGCYIGQEVIARIIKSNKLNQQIRFWEAKGRVLEGNTLYKSSSQDKSSNSVGVITSTLNSESKEISCGLAMIRKNALEEKLLFTSENNTKLSIHVPSGFVGI